MAARRFVMLLVLALCGAPAVAYRDGLDLRSNDDLEAKANAAALATRAGASAGAKVGDSTVGDAKLDLTLKRKEDDEGEEDTGMEGTRCVCLRKDDTVYVEGEELTVNFAQLEQQQGGDCSKDCSSTCNSNLAYRFGKAEAEAVGVEHASFPLRASSCDDGICSCLNARDATKTLEDYLEEGNGGLKGEHIVQVEGKHDTEQECYSKCKCDEEDFSRLCVEPWSWGKFIETDGGSYSQGAVGPTSNSLTQHFALRGGDHTYTAELVTAVEAVEQQELSGLEHEIHSQAMTVNYKAESESYTVQVGFEVGSEGGSGTNWVVEKRKNFAKLGWAVTERDGDGSFSIKDKKKKGLWKIKMAKADKYFAYFHSNDNNGWEIMFYREDDTTSAGSVESGDGSCRVTVEQGEDAGLIMIASVLMAEDYHKKC